ncbi:MAG: phosphopantetheine-binding protein [Bacteroidota bacterium]
MTREEALNNIVEILKTIRLVNQKALANISEDSDFIKDLGLPSAEVINIIAKAEDQFGLEFDDDDVDELGSKVKDTIDLIIKTAEAN